MKRNKRNKSLERSFAGNIRGITLATLKVIAYNKELKTIFFFKKS